MSRYVDLLTQILPSVIMSTATEKDCHGLDFVFMEKINKQKPILGLLCPFVVFDMKSI